MNLTEVDKIDKKKALGRGLASLIPEAISEDDAIISKSSDDTSTIHYLLCDIEKIVPNTYQPRKIFNQEALDELVESVKEHGIIQPLIVRPNDGRFELIAGERRWRAAQRAGLKQVPIVIKRDLEDRVSLEMAIVENIQRENLNCIEEAFAYQQLIDEFKLSQDAVAIKVGKNRATITNTLRLLKLPASIREEITAGKLTMGHARALLSLEDVEAQLEIAMQIIKKKLSVREAERQVSDFIRAKKNGDTPSSLSERDPNIKMLEDDLRQLLGTSVRIVGNEKRGFIQISYSSKETFLELTDKLKESYVS